MAETPTKITDEMVRDTIARATGAMRTQNIAAAHAIAAEAIDRGIEDPFFYKIEGLWRHGRGEYTEALRSFHHARELDQNDPMTLNGIAGSLSAMGAHAEALKMIDAALKIAPDLVTTNYLRAWTLEATHEFAAAKDAYERTLALRPNHVQALTGLAAVAIRLQDYGLARAKAQLALVLAPGQPTATTALARAELETGQPQKAEALLRDLLAKQLAVSARTLATGLLGDALDAQNRVDEAFQAYAEENAVGMPADAPEIGDAVRQLGHRLEAMSGRWSAASESGATTAQGHVFLLGFMRSGTTLVERALASHPDIAVIEEIDLLVEPTATYLTGPDGLQRLLAAAPAELTAARDAYWMQVSQRGLSPDGKIVLDKLPLHTNKLPLIARLFPDAKILFAVRDPRDVVFSCFRRHFAATVLAAEFHTLEGAARLYDATMRIGSWSKANLPLAFHDVRHEALVDDFETGLRAVCAFLGLEWTPALTTLAPSTSPQGMTSASAPQLARGVSREGIGRWRAYAAHLAPVLTILEPWVREFGYPD